MSITLYIGEISENESAFVDSAKNFLFLGNIVPKDSLTVRSQPIVAPSVKTSLSLVPIANALRPKLSKFYSSSLSFETNDMTITAADHSKF